MGYWIGSGRRGGLGVELLLEESKKVVVLDLGKSRGGTGEVPEGRGGVVHGLVREGRRGKEEVWGRERYKERRGGGERETESRDETIKGEHSTLSRRPDPLSPSLHSDGKQRIIVTVVTLLPV